MRGGNPPPELLSLDVTMQVMQRKGSVLEVDSPVRKQENQSNFLGSDSFFEIRAPLPKVVAFYLPQFYQTDYNSRWWGAGFTEWTNVSRARPAFEGHYQPHHPADLGFYDLTAPGAISRQINLAVEFGVDAFCFFHYWFGGQRLLDKPIDLFLELASGFPFMISWANENWTATWDGGDRRVLMEQNYPDGFEAAFIKDAEKYLKHPDYVRDNGAPILVIYRPEDLPSPVDNLKAIRLAAEEIGIESLKILAVKSFGTQDPSAVGADGLIELPPLHFQNAVFDGKVSQTRSWGGSVLDTRKAAVMSVTRPRPSFRFYPGVMPSWDNTPRRSNDSTVFINSSPEIFKLWLAHHLAIEAKESSRRSDLGLVFVNAWNEWAEGAHLEPDLEYGTDWLEAVRDAKEIASKNGGRPELLRQALSHLATQDSSPQVPRRSILNLLEPGYLRGALSLIVRDPSGRELIKAAVRFIKATRTAMTPPTWKPKSSTLITSADRLPLWAKLHCHAHAYHPEFIGEIAEAVPRFPKEASWIVTVPETLFKLGNDLLGAFENCRVVTVHNSGRNFGALVQILSEVPNDHFLLHVHSKRSTHMTKRRASEWASTLKRGLLDPDKVGTALGILQEDASFPIYYPTAERVLSRMGYSWYSNRNSLFAKQLLARLGIPWIDVRFPFPAGAMFIANPWLMGMLRELDLSAEDFPAEPFPLDGSIAHALERIIGYVPHYLGLKHLTLSMDGQLSSDIGYIDFDGTP